MLCGRRARRERRRGQRGEVTMIVRYTHLRQHPTVFQSLTGLRVAEFDALLDDLLPRLHDAEVARLSRPTKDRPQRRRAIGAGHPFALDVRDQVLLTVVWLRVYPTYPVLGYLFGVSAATVERTIPRLLPVLAAAGQESMRAALAALGDPARRLRRRSRRTLDDVLRETPELAVVTSWSPAWWWPPPGASPAGSPAPRRTWPTTPPSRAGASSSSTASGACAGSSRSRRPIATTVRPTPAAAAPPRAWSTAKCGA